MAGMGNYYGFTGAQRSRAQAWWNAQLAKGLRKRPSTCVSCQNFSGVIDGHCEDYSEPFGEHTNAFGLCYRCHMMLHCRFSNPEAFDRFVLVLEEGGRYSPVFRRDFGLVVREHLDACATPTLTGRGAGGQILTTMANLDFLPRPFEMVKDAPAKQLLYILAREGARSKFDKGELQILEGLAK